MRALVPQSEERGTKRFDYAVSERRRYRQDDEVLMARVSFSDSLRVVVRATAQLAMPARGRRKNALVRWHAEEWCVCQAGSLYRSGFYGSWALRYIIRSKGDRLSVA
jgi:hypothetical protein